VLNSFTNIIEFVFQPKLMCVHAMDIEASQCLIDRFMKNEILRGYFRFFYFE